MAIEAGALSRGRQSHSAAVLYIPCAILHTSMVPDCLQRPRPGVLASADAVHAGWPTLGFFERGASTIFNTGVRSPRGRLGARHAPSSQSRRFDHVHDDRGHHSPWSSFDVQSCFGFQGGFSLVHATSVVV